MNAGAAKREGRYLVDYALRHLDDDDLGRGFGSTIVANVMDGAPACLTALRVLQQHHHLLAV